jgi:hypothetical protein
LLDGVLLKNGTLFDGTLFALVWTENNPPSYKNFQFLEMAQDKAGP